MTDPGPRQRLVDAASSLIHARGYDAVGVAELCATAGVQKGSFYHFFASKQALAVEALDQGWQLIRSTLLQETLANPELGALDAIEAYGCGLAARLAAGLEAGGAVNGCRFGNAAVELSTRDEEIRTCVVGVFDEMAAITAEALRRDVRAGRLPDDVDVDTLAVTVITLMEGLMVMAKATRQPERLAALGPTVRRLVG